MRSSRDILAVALLLLLFVAGGLLLGGRGAAPAHTVADDADPDPSVSSDRAAGGKGAFDWAASLGYRPSAWRRPWSELGAGDAGLLLVIDPRVQEPMATLTGGGSDDKTLLAARDARVLRRWLSSGAGHTAVLLTSRLSSGAGGGPPSGGDAETFGDALDVIVESSVQGGGRPEFAPLQPVPETANVLSVHSTSGMRVSRSRPDALALFGDAAGPLAVVVPVGRGRLVVVADGALFSNGNLPRSENAVFLADLLARYAPPGGAVLFDEYHHGDVLAGGGGSVWEALGRPLQLALIQLGLAAVCLAVLLSGRFGPPVPLVRAQVRTSGEYVASLAGLYRRAEASGTALEALYRQFLRDVCARLALPPDVNLERLADVAARRGQIDKERLRRLLATCELRLDQGKVSEAELLDLTRQMDGIRKDIGIA